MQLKIQQTTKTMNRLPTLIAWFLGLLFVQAFVFDPVLLGIPYAPFVYVLLLVFLPNGWAPWIVLLTGFFIGLCVDFIFVSGGVHTAACLLISYARPLLIRAVYRDTITPNNLNIEHESFGSLLRYITLVIVAHHFFVFVAIVGNTARIGWMLNAWLANSLLTLLATVIILILTRSSKK